MNFTSGIYGDLVTRSDTETRVVVGTKVQDGFTGCGIGLFV